MIGEETTLEEEIIETNEHISRDERSNYRRDDRSNGRSYDERRDDRRRDDNPNHPRRHKPKTHVSSRVWKKIEQHQFSKDSNFYDIEE